MKCDSCENLATQITDVYLLCERCWCRNFGTITVDGVKRPFLDVLQDSLEKMGMSRKEGETVKSGEQVAKRQPHSTPRCLSG